MPDTKKIESFVEKLTRLTVEGRIEWSVSSPPRAVREGTDSVIPLCVAARFKGKEIVIFEERFPTFSVDYERFFWSREIVLGIRDIEGHLIWETNEAQVYLVNLFEVAKDSAADIESVFDDFLGDD